MLVRFSPVAQYTKRLGPVILEAQVGGIFGRYFEHGEEDYSDPVSNFSIRMAEDFGLFSIEKRSAGKIQFGLDTDIGQRTETNEQLQDLISYTLYSADASIRYNHSPKFGIESKLGYDLRKYQHLSSQGIPYQDVAAVSIGANAYYIYSQKLDLYVGYSHVMNESPNSNSDFINNVVSNYIIGADGEITPKLSGNVSFGYAMRDYDNASVDSEDTFIFNLGLNWNWREKTRVAFNFSRDFMPSPQDQGMLNTNFGVQVSQRFTKRVAGTLGVNYGIVDFSSYRKFGPYAERNDRTDDRWGLNLSILSSFTSYLDGIFGYSYVTTNSGFGDEFSNDRHRATISLSVQY
jgi:hypothetical protein